VVAFREGIEIIERPVEMIERRPLEASKGGRVVLAVGEQEIPGLQERLACVHGPILTQAPRHRSRWRGAWTGPYSRIGASASIRTARPSPSTFQTGRRREASSATSVAVSRLGSRTARRVAALLIASRWGMNRVGAKEPAPSNAPV